MGVSDLDGLARETHIVAHSIWKGEPPDTSDSSTGRALSRRSATCSVSPQRSPESPGFYHSFDPYAMYI
jgi:hypothetical protein